MLDSKNITSLDINKRNIGYCPQDQLLFPHLNVFDNIAMGLKAKHLSKNEIKAQVEILAKMSDIEPLLKRKVNQISGGQKQRVSILRALAINPQILLLDEPFHNLDAQIKDQIVNYIKKIQSIMNIAIIFVTHDISEAKLLADKILILIEGKMGQVGTSKELSYQPKSYAVAKAMTVPNIFEINRFNEQTKALILSFGDVFLTKMSYNDQKTLFIDPTGIKLNSLDRNNKNIFQGTIKGIIFDLVTNKQIIDVQIEKKDLQSEELLRITLEGDEGK